MIMSMHGSQGRDMLLLAGLLLNLMVHIHDL